MRKARIKELDRAAQQVREVLVVMTGEELEAVTLILQNAGFATALETYSRQNENLKSKESALV